MHRNRQPRGASRVEMSKDRRNQARLQHQNWSCHRKRNLRGWDIGVRLETYASQAFVIGTSVEFTIELSEKLVPRQFRNLFAFQIEFEGWGTCHVDIVLKLDCLVDRCFNVILFENFEVLQI